jgi:hypothetical protein
MVALAAAAEQSGEPARAKPGRGQCRPAPHRPQEYPQYTAPMQALNSGSRNHSKAMLAAAAAVPRSPPAAAKVPSSTPNCTTQSGGRARRLASGRAAVWRRQHFCKGEFGKHGGKFHCHWHAAVSQQPSRQHMAGYMAPSTIDLRRRFFCTAAYSMPVPSPLLGCDRSLILKPADFGRSGRHFFNVTFSPPP